MVITKHRLLSVTTHLGPEVFLLTAFSGREEISRGFRYELEMLSDRDAAAARKLVGQEISWSVRTPGAEPRWFHGVVSRLVAGARAVRDLRTYRAVVVPQLWYDGQQARCRIFEDRTVPEIVDAVLARRGQTEHGWALAAEYPRRKLCVQYRESDLQFVSRLLEEEGISFFFQHEEDRNTLVLADDALTSEADPGEEVVYRPGNPGVDRVDSWERQFDGPGTDTSHEIVNGSSGCCRFTPGEAFTLRGHDTAGENGTYLLVAVEHAARDVSFTADGGGREYVNTFTCVPAAVPFRPARLSLRPTVRGARFATIVEPPEGGENADDSGRVRVRFSGESQDRWEEDASCWVRVVGAVSVVPAVGQEVLVEFLEGDPERPSVAGGTRDACQAAPAAPADTGSKGLRFVEDEGRTAVVLEAGQDCRRVVANDDVVTVGGDQFLEVRNHRTRIITNGNESIHLEKGHRSLILNEGDETIRLEKGSRTVVLEMGDEILSIKAGNHTTRLDLGRSTTEAMHGIELRVGPSRISIDPTGIVIEGLVVKVRGHAQTEINGLMTQLGADGVLEVKGGATVMG